MSFWDPFHVFSHDPFFRNAFNDSFFREPYRAIEPNQDRSQSTSLAQPSRFAAAFRTPRMDVTETDKGYLIKADCPGLEKKDINISLQDDLLTIEGERKEERVEESATRHLTERSWGKFSRSFRLPADVNPESVSANMEHGVLSINFNKRPAGQGRKRIEIK